MVKESTDRVICEQRPEMGKKLARAIRLRQKHTDLKKRLMWLEWVEQKGKLARDEASEIMQRS